MKYFYLTAIHLILAISLFTNINHDNALIACLRVQEQQENAIVKVRMVRDFIKESTVEDKRATFYAEMYIKAGKEFILDPMLLAVVGRFESNFNPAAESGMGAIGLQQVMPFWVHKIPFIKSIQDLYSPELNIRASAYILSHYRELCGNSVESMATCYHGGPGAMLRPKPSTTKFKTVVSNLFYEVKAAAYATGI
jgi:soluble lytic murein transglycosylase-like protein